MLNDMFTVFDQMCDTFGVYKVETIGERLSVAGQGGPALAVCWRGTQLMPCQVSWGRLVWEHCWCSTSSSCRALHTCAPTTTKVWA